MAVSHQGQPQTSIHLDSLYPLSTIDPFKQGQSGFYNGYVVGRTDVARRIAGLVPARFVNRATNVTSSWTISNNGGTNTFTQGLSDPFGGTGAASISNNTSNDNTITMGSVNGYTPATGDWIVAGIWAQGLAQTGDSFVLGCPGNPTNSTSYVYKSFGMIKGDGQWQYIWMAQKMVSGPSSAVCNLVHFNNTSLLHSTGQLYM